MATKLDLFMAEVKAYDYKWFDEIGGNEALQEIGELREQASGLTQRALDKVPVRLSDACPTCGGCDVQCAECLSALCK